MKHGKKYTEAAKLVDRATFYEPNDDVTLSSRSVVQLYCLTEPVRL